MIGLADVTVTVPNQTIGGLSAITEKNNRTISYQVTPVPAMAAGVAGNQVSYSSMFFVGDVLLGRNVEYLMSENDINYPFAGFDFRAFADNPAVVVNFESAVPQAHVPTKPNQLVFSTTIDNLEALTTAGVTHASLANNHSFDFGSAGFVNTKSALQKQGLTAFGSPHYTAGEHITYSTVHDSTVALISLSTVSAPLPDAQVLKQLFSQANAQSDLQIVFMHWGEEYSNKSSSAQRDAAKRLVAAGADVIVGHHPHVVQEVGLISGVPVFYSLGNYVFDQYFSRDVQEGLVLQLLLGSNPKLSLLPVESHSRLSQPQLLKRDEHKAFLTDLANRSDQKLREGIMQGYVPLRTVASSYKMAMITK